MGPTLQSIVGGDQTFSSETLCAEAGAAAANRRRIAKGVTRIFSPSRL
jgi:hypothetical protein